jgi:hypothetical protein
MDIPQKSSHMYPPQTVYSFPVTRTQPLPNSMIFAPNQAANVNDYMAWSVFNCICCCWPMGIVALILSAVISGKKNEGNVEGAKKLSTGTAIWNGFTTVLGIGLNIFIIIYYTQMRSY